MKSIRFLLMLAVAAVLVISAYEPALAQCAMCRTSLENSTDAEAASRTLSVAALVLLVPPVAIFAGLFGIFYRFRNVQGGSRSHDSAAKQASES